MLSSRRTPFGYTYRWSLLVVHPDSSSSAMAVCVDTRTICGVRWAQMGYRPDSHPNSSQSCTAGTARVSVWYMWWWVLTSPGRTI